MLASPYLSSVTIIRLLMTPPTPLPLTTPTQLTVPKCASLSCTASESRSKASLTHWEEGLSLTN